VPAKPIPPEKSTIRKTSDPRVAGSGEAWQVDKGDVIPGDVILVWMLRRRILATRFSYQISG
jgi:hypothetical protein